MKRKVLLAIPQLTGGGAERVVSVWANELAEKGYDVHILVFSPSEDEYYVRPDVKVEYLAPTINEYLSMSYFGRIKSIRKYLKKIKVDYIISFLPAMQVWMMLASRGLRCKRLETIRVNPWRISLTDKLQTFMWKMCYHSCYKIILQASDQKPFFSKHDQKKCVMIPNPISEVYVKDYRKDLDDDPTTFVAAGRIDPQKNYIMMINAFASVSKNHPDISLRIFGKGDPEYVSSIQRHIDELGMQNNITLMGRSPHMEEEYKKNNIFLMTSDYEGLPNALMEGMASQLICISTDCKTGPKDLIVHGVNGFLVNVGDENSLADTIEKVLNMNPAERTSIAKAARDKVLEHCSKENSINVLCGLLK